MFENLFYCPFNIKYKNVQQYIRLSITDHRLYKDIFVSINIDTDQTVFVWVTLVCKDSSIICYCNNQERVDYTKKNIPQLNLFYAPIHVLTEAHKNHPIIYIYFRTNKSEKIEIIANCYKEPKESSSNFEKDRSSFVQNYKVIMYKHQTASLCHKSKVYIMGREYALAGRRKIPMFSNITGEYCKNFDTLSIPSFNETLSISEIDTNTTTNCNFKYKKTSGDVNYKITSILDDNRIITGENRLFRCVKTSLGYEIESIEILSNPNAPIMSFNPPLPIYPANIGDIFESDMIISCGKNSVSGKVLLNSKDKKSLEYVFICDALGWKDLYPLRSYVNLTDNELKIVTTSTHTPIKKRKKI